MCTRRCRLTMCTTVVEQVVSVTPHAAQPRPFPGHLRLKWKKKQVKVEPVEPVEQMALECGVGELSSGDSDETGSEDESVKYDL